MQIKIYFSHNLKIISSLLCLVYHFLMKQKQFKKLYNLKINPIENGQRLKLLTRFQLPTPKTDPTTFE